MVYGGGEVLTLFNLPLYTRHLFQILCFVTTMLSLIHVLYIYNTARAVKGELWVIHQFSLQRTVPPTPVSVLCIYDNAEDIFLNNLWNELQLLCVSTTLHNWVTRWWYKRLRQCRLSLKWNVPFWDTKASTRDISISFVTRWHILVA